MIRVVYEWAVEPPNIQAFRRDWLEFWQEEDPPEMQQMRGSESRSG